MPLSSVDPHYVEEAWRPDNILAPDEPSWIIRRPLVLEARGKTVRCFSPHDSSLIKRLLSPRDCGHARFDFELSPKFLFRPILKEDSSYIHAIDVYVFDRLGKSSPAA